VRGSALVVLKGSALPPEVLYRRGSQRVLVFRGSYSEGDFANIENWITCVLLTVVRVDSVPLPSAVVQATNSGEDDGEFEARLDPACWPALGLHSCQPGGGVRFVGAGGYPGGLLHDTGRGGACPLRHVPKRSSPPASP
jgi:hypothetical protein